MRDLVDRLLARARAADPDDAESVERVLRERFRFLEERQGFELAEASRLEDGAVAAYANRPAGRALVVFARRDRGAWAGVTRLGSDGELPPVNRETVRRGVWRELRRVDVRDDRGLDEALADLASSLRGGRA